MSLEIKRRKFHRRGTNKNLTEEEIEEKKRQQQRERSKRAYIKYIEKRRTQSLQKYHEKAKNKEPAKRGRPLKYI